MRGAMLCLSADLTTHAVYNFSPCTHIVAVAAATPQERAAAAVPALRRGTDKEQGCSMSRGAVAS